MTITIVSALLLTLATPASTSTPTPVYRVSVDHPDWSASFDAAHRRELLRGVARVADLVDRADFGLGGLTWCVEDTRAATTYCGSDDPTERPWGCDITQGDDINVCILTMLDGACGGCISGCDYSNPEPECTDEGGPASEAGEIFATPPAAMTPREAMLTMKISDAVEDGTGYCKVEGEQETCCDAMTCCTNTQSDYTCRHRVFLGGQLPKPH